MTLKKVHITLYYSATAKITTTTAGSCHLSKSMLSFKLPSLSVQSVIMAVWIVCRMSTLTKMSGLFLTAAISETCHQIVCCVS